MHKSGYKYKYIRDEHCCFADVTQSKAHGLVPLFLWFNGKFSDHLISSDKAFNISGQVNVHSCDKLVDVLAYMRSHFPHIHTLCTETYRAFT